jgi:tetratricopeptide (TPR) repeat protein/CHAT domain-containing protein
MKRQSVVIIVFFLLQLVPCAAESGDDLTTLWNRVGELFQAGKYREAIPFAEKIVVVTESSSGRESPETAEALNILGKVYNEAGELKKAEPAFTRALQIFEKARGSEHPDVATALNNLGVLSDKTGDYKKSESFYERAIAIREKTLGPDDPLTVSALSNLGSLYYSQGEFAKAEPLMLHALATKEKVKGAEDSDTITSVSNLAALYSQMGEYAKAEPLYERALRVREKLLGPEHPDTATSLNNYANFNRAIGDFTKAEALFERSLKILEKTLGSENPLVSGSLNNLAVCYKSEGNFARAEPLYRRGLDISEKANGPEHPVTATNLNNLALLYLEMGDTARAKPLFERARAILEKAVGPNHRLTAGTLQNLAALYEARADHAAAEPLCRRTLQINESTLGSDHPAVATSLNNLAGIYRDMGRFAEAEPLLQRAARIYEKTLGPNHPELAQCLNNLGELYEAMGQPERAEPLYRRALKILETALGPDHPDTIPVLNNLAILKIASRATDEALELSKRIERAGEKHLTDILSFTSEKQRLEFQKTVQPYTLFVMLGRAPELADALLRYKGIVLDSLLEDRLVAEASNDPEQREMIDRARSVKQRMWQLELEIPKDLSPEAHQRRVIQRDALAQQADLLEATLARRVAKFGAARRGFGVTACDVQAALSEGQALVGCVRYSHYLGKGRWEPRYDAVVIASGELKWVPLGNASAIEGSIRLYQKSVRGKTDETTLARVLHELATQVWAPIVDALPPEVKSVIIAPDAELNSISFATLLSRTDEFACQKYSIRYVASGRDLLTEVKSPASKSLTMRVFANPDFAANGDAGKSAGETTNGIALRSAEMHDFQGISFPNLPGTQKESAALEVRAKEAGWQLQAYVGPNATEAELRNVHTPRILHLATHGFFLPEIDLASSSGSSRKATNIRKGKLANPMHRSGLAVARAEGTLQAWDRGEVPPTENDGIVTAEEVGGLKLDGTWLVTLSACDTGGGEARAGEGVMGLRRGFVQAGAQNLLMTLWPISDEITVQIMLDFYDAAFNSGNAPLALAETQRNWLVKLRKERGLLQAVRLAGPFIMSSQGKQ